MTEQNNTFDYDRYYGKTVIDANGDKVGDVGQVYLDDATGRPEWVTVRTGLFGTKETFVPLTSEDIHGDELRVPYTKDQIKGAPGVDPSGHITETEEDALYRYYSVGDETSAHGTADDRVADDCIAEDRAAFTTDGVAATGFASEGVTAGAGTSRVANATDVADGDVIRHEERLNVGTETHETGRVRIRKHVVTEQQTIQVPVSHEEIRIERVDIADGEATGRELAEGETEVILHEERPVVSKDTVAVERISVGKEQVTENQTVSESISKEQVDVVQDGVADGHDRVSGRTDDRSFADKVKDKLDANNDGVVGH